ncbi:MAG TPA: hypothetical protein GX724_06460 [Fibrobacter sp.]|nr:hypothetical protein [Fibrobacter sp.]
MRGSKYVFLIIALLLSSFSVVFSANVAVYTLDEQFSSNNLTVLRFKVENNSQDTIKDFELHYHVVQDTGKIAKPEIYYMPAGMVNWVFNSKTSATLVIYFPGLSLFPGEILGGESGFSIGMHNTDWSTWSKSNDPSQPNSNQFSVANNIDVIASGESVMLGKTKYKNCPVVQFVEVQSDTIALQVLQQLNSDILNLSIKSLEGDLASINLNESTADSLGQKIWRGYVPVQDTNRGEFWVECNGHKLTYFAYGWIPKASENAVNNSLWESNEAFVQANFDMGFNQGLRAKERLILNTDSLGKFVDARFIANWKFYRPWEDPGEPQIPGILYPAFGAAYEPAEDMDSLTFEWTSLDGIEWYNLLVMKDSIGGDTIVSITIEGTSIRIPIFQEAGNYVWYADPLIEVNEGEEYDFEQINPNTPMILRKAWYKRLGSYAKRTVKKATQIFTPIIYSYAYDEPLWKSIKTSIKYSLNPIGIITILAPNITLHTKKLSINKKLTYLDLSYRDQAYEFDTYDWNACKDKNHFCASKDTKVLQTEWNTEYHVNEITWDKVVFKPKKSGKISTASNRCWLTMAQALNHHYGGSIPQDQIMYHVRQNFSNYEGGGPLETMQAVNYALGMDILDQALFTIAAQAYKAGSTLPSFNGWSIFSPHVATIIQNLEQGKPIGVSQLNGSKEIQAHSMLIDGYKIQSNGNMHVHLLNTDNIGSSEWRYYCNFGYLGLDVLLELINEGFVHLVNAISGKSFDTDDIFFSYFTPPTFVSARATDTRLFTDSDGDGMIDFDEEERFGTSSISVDTDGDGIEDKQEIFDYAACQDLYNVDNLADIDGDGMDAQLDIDSDGDGFCDLQEAGYIKDNISACARFDPLRFPVDQIPLCENYNVAWLASDAIYINDRAFCTDQNGKYCPVVSFNGASTEEYGVRMGVSAKLGSIYSAKSVLMRNNALVTGFVETQAVLVKQSSTAIVLGNVKEHSNTRVQLKEYYANLLNSKPLNTDFTEKRSANVNANETKSIKSFIVAPEGLNLTVNSNGRLKLESGSFTLSSLKINNDAMIEMPETGNVELYIGKEFQWKGRFTSNNFADIAQRLKIYYVGSNSSYIETNFAAMIVAPNAKVVLGQSGKYYYGSVYAKSIVVHQNTKFTWIPYKSPSGNLAMAKTN